MEKIYQTFKAVFDHITNNLEVRQKYFAMSCIFNCLLDGSVVKHGLSYFTYYFQNKTLILKLGCFENYIRTLEFHVLRCKR